MSVATRSTILRPSWGFVWGTGALAPGLVPLYVPNRKRVWGSLYPLGLREEAAHYRPISGRRSPHYGAMLRFLLTAPLAYAIVVSMAPPLASPSGYSNPYEGRWRWWYTAIAEWMLDHPDGTLQDCARDIGRGYNTVCMIASTDLFKAHLAMRRKDYQARRDTAVISKLTAVANRSLDIIGEVLDKKRDQVPLKQLESLATSALDRLGFAPQPVQTTINNTIVNSQSRPSVTLEELESARRAYRSIQEQNRSVEIEHEPAPQPQKKEVAYDPLTLPHAASTPARMPPEHSTIAGEADQYSFDSLLNLHPRHRPDGGTEDGPAI